MGWDGIEAWEGEKKERKRLPPSNTNETSNAIKSHTFALLSLSQTFSRSELTLLPA